MPGTEPIDESVVAVPLRYGSRVNGVVFLSQLGVDRFDENDVRLLEVLAGYAASALENARLYESLRREAEHTRAWLEFSDELSSAGSLEAMMNATVVTVARLLEADQCSLWLEDDDDGDFECAASHGYVEEADRRRDRARARDPGRAAEEFIRSRKTPFLMTAQELHDWFFSHIEAAALKPVATAPLPPGPRRQGLDHGARACRRPRSTSPGSACACWTGSPTAPRWRCSGRCSTASSRRTPRSRTRCSTSAARSRRPRASPTRWARRARSSPACSARPAHLRPARRPGPPATCSWARRTAWTTRRSSSASQATLMREILGPDDGVVRALATTRSRTLSAGRAFAVTRDARAARRRAARALRATASAASSPPGRARSTSSTSSTSGCWPAWPTRPPS